MKEFKFPFSTTELEDCKIDHENVMNNVENIVYGFGTDVTVSYDQSQAHMIFDLNTHAKSELKMILKVNEGVLAWQVRYNTPMPINTLWDVLDTVKFCMHGRDYIDPQWLKALEHYGLITVRRKVVSEIIH